jgi:hypothetical protein
MTFKPNYLLPAGVRPGQANRYLDGFAAGVAEHHLSGTRHKAADLLCDPPFKLMLGADLLQQAKLPGDNFVQPWIAMAQNQRPPGQCVVNVAIVININ